jgi:hypothetical protein
MLNIAQVVEVVKIDGWKLELRLSLLFFRLSSSEARKGQVNGEEGSSP